MALGATAARRPPAGAGRRAAAGRRSAPRWDSPCAIASARALRGLLFGIEPLDPLAMGAAALLLAAAAMLSLYVPGPRRGPGGPGRDAANLGG